MTAVLLHATGVSNGVSSVVAVSHVTAGHKMGTVSPSVAVGIGRQFCVI